jgi:hypothetical protein
VYREVFGSSMDLARDALVALGKTVSDADRIVQLFRTHDDKVLRAAAPMTEDEDKLIDLARQSRAEIARVFTTDRNAEKKND